MAADNNFPTLTSGAGFTLIELLVVIAIIAVLAVIGFAAFTGIIPRANNPRRSADIKSIADAIEVKRGTSSTYIGPIAATDFATGKFPSEPTSRTEHYCYKEGTTAIPNPPIWNGTACLGDEEDSTWRDVSGRAPSLAGTATYFKVCTMNDKLDAVICYGSRQ